MAVGELFLRQVAADRARVCLPIILFALLTGLLVSETLGIPLNATVVSVNVAVLVIGAGLWSGFVWRPALAVRHGHVVGAITFLLCPTTTLASQWSTGIASLSTLILIEVITASIQVSTVAMVATTAVVIGAWIPLGIRDAGAESVFQIVSVIVAGLTAFTTHLVVRRSLVLAEELRLDERRATEELARELAERKRVESDREQLREQFIHAQRMEAVGTLTAGLAHDMNNILAGILGFAEILHDGATDEQSREDTEAIMKAAVQGGALTRSLLAFGRRGQHRRHPVSLREVLDSLAPMLSRTLPKSISVERSIEAEPVVDVDDAQLGQAIVNLCLNAADAMEGSGRLTLGCGQARLDTATAARLGVSAAAQWAMLSVTDTGRGMDEATRRRIFEPFFTTKPPGQGTGLGLAMVCGAIHGHGGVIDVETAPGAGTTFRIYLPVVDAVPTSPTVRSSDSGRLSRRHVVMVVDDEQLVRTATTRILERTGVLVVGASSGEEALRVYEERQRDVSLVVLDMAMPGMGGAACFRELRRRGATRILLVSGAVDRDVQDLLSAGAVGIVDKPFNAASLLTQVESALTGRLGLTTTPGQQMD